MVWGECDARDVSDVIRNPASSLTPVHAWLQAGLISRCSRRALSYAAKSFSVMTPLIECACAGLLSLADADLSTGKSIVVAIFLLQE